MDDISMWIVQNAPLHSPRVYFALHVSALSLSQDDEYLAALEIAEGLYADGVSIVALSRLKAGASQITRSPTTDLGIKVLTDFKLVMGRAPKVALIGGPEGLSLRAGIELQKRTGANVVFTSSGYFNDSSSTIDRLRSTGPDYVFVGLGAPLEMKWIAKNFSQFPPSRVLSCGGWFSFLAGDELRAPSWVQALGMEWIWRLAQNPAKLYKRYGKGAVQFIVFLFRKR